jgi:hypothetical protein
MTIVVDVNSFPSVFDPSNEHHADFLPVKDWIHRRDGFLIFGGTTFKNELIKSHHRSRLVRLLKDAGMAIEVRDEVVDRLEEVVKGLTQGSTCDDPHLIALLAAARCPLLCSQDKRSFPFIKDKSYFPKGSCKVRIYTGIRNASLLTPTKRSSIANAV